MKGYLPGKASLGQTTHVPQHLVDVYRTALDGAVVGKHLHAIHQGDDAVGLFADQTGQQPVALIRGGLQKLGGAANARERVLDLMPQQGRHPSDRTRGATMGQLVVELALDGALVQRHNDVAFVFVDCRDVDRNQARSDTRCLDSDAELRDGMPTDPNLLHQHENRMVGRQQVRQRPAQQGFRRLPEKLLGRQVDVDEAAALIEHEQRL